MKKVLGAAMGNCVHVAGITNFLKTAELYGYETVFLGPAVPIKEIVNAIVKLNPDIVALSYRLTPEVAKKLFEELKKEIDEKGLKDKRYFFGGTPAVCEIASETKIFEVVFSGKESLDDVITCLKGEAKEMKEVTYPQTLLDRIKSKSPYPLIRHHLGLPSFEATVESANKVAKAKVVDILSIAPDQNAQQYFFEPEKMNSMLEGAGGVPLRKAADLKRIYEATKTGNFPLVRCYSGTQKLIEWAEMLFATISNAWGAIPLTWYSELDGRSERKLVNAIEENQLAIKWHAERNIPVEVTESHQWALRGCGDVIEVATAYLAAYNAKQLGVDIYVQQYMFNVPSDVSLPMDLAKMLAKAELVESLQTEDFKTIRMTRTGLTSMSTDFEIAKGQLAASINAQLYLKPEIVHVVAYCEGDYAASHEEIIESCKIATGAIKSALFGLPDLRSDRKIQDRKMELIKDARFLIESIRKLGINEIDPLISPEVIAKSIEIGMLDAPQLKGSKVAKGKIITKVIDGACYAIDPETKTPLKEVERIKRIFQLYGVEKVTGMD